MNYTIITLAALGIFGIIIHNLVKLNKLNRENQGTLNFGKYLALERFTILLSICVVAVALIIRTEIKELEIAGKYLGFAFVAIGYTAQSIVTSYSSRAERFIKATNNQEQPKP